MTTTGTTDDNPQEQSEKIISINEVLIDDCLLRLFAEFRLAEQLGGLRAVCRRWRRLLETVIFSPENGHHHHSVKLFGSSEAATIRDYCRTVTATFFSSGAGEDQQEELAISSDELIIPATHFTTPLFDQLTQLLPNLLQLTVWFDGESPFRELPALLEAGLPNLNRLILLGQIKTFDPVGGEDRFLERLCQALNKRTILTRLDLLPINLLRSAKAVQMLTTELGDLLPRLTSLSLKLFGCRADLRPLLAQLTAGLLRSLRLESIFFFDMDELQEMLLVNDGLIGSLEELRVSGVGRQFLHFIAGGGETRTLFTSLKRLSLGFSGVPQIEALLFEALNNLPQLTDLTFENLLLEMNLCLNELTSLPAIRHLTLAGLDLGRFTFDDYRFLCILGTAFPGLEALTLRCVNSIDEREAVGAFAMGAAECFRHLKAEAVRLEREKWPVMAGKYEENSGGN